MFRETLEELTTVEVGMGMVRSPEPERKERGEGGVCVRINVEAGVVFHEVKSSLAETYTEIGRTSLH